MNRDPTFIGTVQDVNGATVRVELTNETATGSRFIRGEGYRIGQIGSFVRIPFGFVDLYGIVSQVGAGAAPVSADETKPYGNLWLQVQLVGEGRQGHRFVRGISQHPTVEDRVHIVTESDLRDIYGPGDPDDFVAVGHLASAESIPSLVDINKLVTRHSAVVGTTGAGKSTTVAGLLSSLSDPKRYPSSRIVIFDIHGEYARALSDRSTVYRVGGEAKAGEKPLHIPFWALNFEEFAKLAFGSAEAKDIAGIQDRFTAARLETFKMFPKDGTTADRITVDSPVPFSIHQLWYDLHCEAHGTFFEDSTRPQGRETWALEKDDRGRDLVGDPAAGQPPTFRPPKDEKNDTEKIRLSKSTLPRKPIDALGNRLRDPRFDFLFKPGEWAPSLNAMPFGN